MQIPKQDLCNRKDMNRPERNHRDSIWTDEDIQKLLVEMKRSVPEEYTTRSYIVGMKNIQWENVAFPPFSAEACQAKWQQILQRIRKMRSLTELISEAEETFTNFINPVDMGDKPPLQSYNRKTGVCRKQISGINKRLKTNDSTVSEVQVEEKSEDFLQDKPPHTAYNLFCKEKMEHIKGVPKKSIVIVLAQHWKELTENEKKEYSTRCKELKRQYTLRIPVQTNTPKAEDLLPVKPPSTGYNLFCKEQVKDMKGVDKNSYCYVLAKCWKELTEKKRKEYSERCSQLKRQYQNDLTCCLKMEEEEKKRPILSQHTSRKKYKYVNGEEREEFTTMQSDSEDEDVTDNSSDEDLCFDSAEIEEEEGKDMSFTF